MDKNVRELVVLISINVFAILASVFFNANFLVSTFLFLGVPAIYLLILERHNAKKILLASVSHGIFLGFILDFLAEINRFWDWDRGLYFGKILGVVPVDVMIWLFFWVLHIFAFYEHFIDRKKMRSKLSDRQWMFSVFSILSVVLFLAFYYYFPKWVYFPKAYLLVGIAAYIPFIIYLIKKPKLILHIVPSIAYFFFVYISHELTALYLKQWSFHGDYIGWLHIHGFSLPFEEIFFWITLSGLICSTYYELSFDNQKN